MFFACLIGRLITYPFTLTHIRLHTIRILTYLRYCTSWVLLIICVTMYSREGTIRYFSMAYFINNVITCQKHIRQQIQQFPYTLYTSRDTPTPGLLGIDFQDIRLGTLTFYEGGSFQKWLECFTHYKIPNARDQIYNLTLQLV